MRLSNSDRYDLQAQLIDRSILLKGQLWVSLNCSCVRCLKPFDTTPPSRSMRVLKSAATYFALVFGAGFVFGAVRVTWLVPRLGERAAELAEMPLMFVVIVFAARFVVRRFALPPNRPTP